MEPNAETEGKSRAEEKGLKKQFTGTKKNETHHRIKDPTKGMYTRSWVFGKNDIFPYIFAFNPHENSIFM